MTQQNNEQDYNAFLSAVANQKEVWILTDQHGSVMLNTDDEDCVPVWASETEAAAWISDEWNDCEPEAIPLKVWQHRWTAGLEEDEFCVVVSPKKDQDGLVIHPEDLDADLRKAIKKASA